MKKFTFLIIILLIQVNSISGQIKFESEFRLKEKEVPQEALEFVSALNFTKKIRWYKEQGLNRISIEAKTKHESKKYSIEFDSTGQLEDIEIEIKWKEIPSSTQNNISKYLDAIHQKFSLNKIQIQYTGNKGALIDKITNQASIDEISIHYEIIVKAKTGRKHQMLEYLFTQKGEMVKKSVIIFRNTDNLEY